MGQKIVYLKTNLTMLIWIETSRDGSSKKGTLGARTENNRHRRDGTVRATIASRMLQQKLHQGCMYDFNCEPHVFGRSQILIHKE